MAIFNQSSIPWATAVETIADCIGASGDHEMRMRAHRSLRATFQWLGGKGKWDFMRTEFTPQRVVAPFSVAASATGASAVITVPTSHGIEIDDIVQGNGLFLGTRALATGATTITLTTAVSGITTAGGTTTVTAIRDLYSAPSDMRTGYSVRLLGSQKALRYVGHRLYGRVQGDEFAVDQVPTHYDLFLLGAKSKVRLIAPPGASDTLFQRYYRRFTLAVSSASATGLALDIPEDYEDFVIARAKWHFLTDKGEGRKDQATVWHEVSKDGLAVMLSEQNSQADEDLMIIPGHSAGDFDTTRSTSYLPWEYA